MKIIILSDDFPPKSFGGAGIIAYGQACELAKRGHEVTVITTTQNKKDVGKNIYEGLTVFSLYSNVSERFRSYTTMYNPLVIKDIHKIISENHPDAVHVHNVHSQISYHSILIAKKYSKKVLITFHDVMSFHYGKLFPEITFDNNGKKVFNYKVTWISQLRDYKFRWNPLRNICIKFYLKKVDIKLAVSRALADALLQNGIKNVSVMRNTINVDSFSLDPKKVSAFKDKYRLHGKKVLFFGGRLSGAKGIDVAMKALVEINKIIPDARLLVVGQDTGTYVQGLRKDTQSSKVLNNVVFTGWLDRKEIISAYYASDIVLTLSIYMDPLVIINLEAMAAKKPVIGTCFGGTPEVVIDNETGFIVDPHDLSSVVKAVSILLNDAALSEKFGQAGYRRVLKEFQLAKQVDVLERMYVAT